MFLRQSLERDNVDLGVLLGTPVLVGSGWWYARSADSGPNLFTALVEQAGLKLQAERAKVRFGLRRTNRSAMRLVECCLVAACVLTLLAVNVRADITARWELHADFDDRRIPGASGDCTFRQDGGRFSGRCEDATVIGEVKGESVTWRLTPAGTHDSMIFTGMLDDDDTVIVGRFTYAGKGNGSFLAVRRKTT